MCNRKGHQSPDLSEGDAWNKQEIRHKYVRARALFWSQWSIQQESLQFDRKEICNRSYGCGNSDTGEWLRENRITNIIN